MSAILTGNRFTNIILTGNKFKRLSAILAGYIYLQGCQPNYHEIDLQICQLFGRTYVY